MSICRSPAISMAHGGTGTPSKGVPRGVELARSRRFTANPYETAIGLCQVWVGDRLDDRLACLQRSELPKQFVPRIDTKIAGLHRRATFDLDFGHVCLHLSKSKAATKWHARLQQMEKEKENFRSGLTLLNQTLCINGKVGMHLQVRLSA